MKAALTIVESDSSRDAGIQVDIKTMTAHEAYVVSAITTSTTQDITGMTGIMEVTPPPLKEQLDNVFADIFPGAVKTGMVPSGGLIEAIGGGLAFYRVANVVVDPVMVSTSGSRLISGGAIEALEKVLLPTVNLLIPNIPKAEVLSGMEVYNPGDMEKATRAIEESYDCAAFLKGGHQLNDANGLLYRHRKLKWFNGRRTDSPSTRGTGCTLSSVIASNLVKGADMDLAVKRVKVYLSGTLEAWLDLRKGNGPVNHGLAIRGEY